MSNPLYTSEYKAACDRLRTGKGTKADEAIYNAANAAWRVWARAQPRKEIRSVLDLPIAARMYEADRAEHNRGAR